LAEILAAQAAHEATLRPQTNEMAKGVDPALKVCGCPNSQQQHPNLPNCTCNPENFEVFVCGPVFESVCRANARDSSDTIQQQCGPFKANDARTWPIQPSFTLQPS
jgi:arylsulfatase A